MRAFALILLKEYENIMFHRTPATKTAVWVQ